MSTWATTTPAQHVGRHRYQRPSPGPHATPLALVDDPQLCGSPTTTAVELPPVEVMPAWLQPMPMPVTTRPERRPFPARVYGPRWYTPAVRWCTTDWRLKTLAVLAVVLGGQAVFGPLPFATATATGALVMLAVVAASIIPAPAAHRTRHHARALWARITTRYRP